jgi:ABC-type branched-subunit amino acid transport system substrate-binding protein
MASILGYTRVAILANTDAYGSGVAAAFMEACQTEDIDVPLYLSFEPVDSGAEQDLDSKLMQIKSANLRVIMLAGQVRPNRKTSYRLLPQPRPRIFLTWGSTWGWAIAA